MKSSFPLLVCFASAIILLAAALVLRNAETAIDSHRVGLSQDQWQKTTRRASWGCFAGGCILIAGAILVAILSR
jgi:hypothetical protein